MSGNIGKLSPLLLSRDVKLYEQGLGRLNFCDGTRSSTAGMLHRLKQLRALHTYPGWPAGGIGCKSAWALRVLTQHTHSVHSLRMASRRSLGGKSAWALRPLTRQTLLAPSIKVASRRHWVQVSLVAWDSHSAHSLSTLTQHTYSGRPVGGAWVASRLGHCPLCTHTSRRGQDCHLECKHQTPHEDGVQINIHVHKHWSTYTTQARDADEYSCAQKSSILSIKAIDAYISAAY
eukprot:1158895-Pelagomonas_calceolata.AAC.3